MSHGDVMREATTLAGAALDVSEAASREDHFEYDSLKAMNKLIAKADRDMVRLNIGGLQFVEVPASMVDFLKQLTAVLDRGEGVVASEIARDLTTSEAAQMLGMSTPTLIGLVNKGSIPSREVGTNRRITLGDVLVYRRRQAEQQRIAYEQIMAEQDELGIYE